LLYESPGRATIARKFAVSLRAGEMQVALITAEQIKKNIDVVCARIQSICDECGRDRHEITLIAVSKNFPGEAVRYAQAHGIRDFGENRVQEAMAKFGQLDDIRAQCKLHYIGRLQSNKVKDVTNTMDIVHSIDSIRIARLINDAAPRKIQGFLQVNISGETTKGGFNVDELSSAVEVVSNMDKIEVLGLMTIAPLSEQAESVRPIFRKLRQLNCTFGFSQLSMGMSDDYEVALQEGATMIRIGRAIFGERS
jgi:pyridoxal phosphate enzyme (YggS family)